jgi:HK97 family phage portal protein
MERLFGRAGAPPAQTITPTTLGVQSVPYLDSRAALGVSAVWRCVTLIADAIADMPWQEWRGDELLPSSRLVRRPCSTMTRREWTWRVVATEALYNTVYCLHVGGYDSTGKPWSLLPLPSTVISPLVYDMWGILPPSAYTVAGQRVEASDITIIRRAPFPGVTENLAGILEVARRQFTAYVAADVHMARYWTAGGPTTTVITTDQELTDDDASDLAQRWIDRRAMGTDHPAVLGKGAEAKPWGSDPTSESAVAARDQMNADIARHFGVPTRIVNAPAGDSETYSNVENDAIDLWRYTLRGYAGPIEDAVSGNLPGDPIEGRRMQVDPARLLQGNLVDRSSAWVALVSAGIADADEARVKGFALPARAATDVAQEPPSISGPAETGVAVTLGGSEL